MIAVYRASVAQARGDVDGTLSHARRALALAGPQDHFQRGAAAGFIGLAAWAGGDLATAVDTFTEAVVALHAAGMVADELGATVVLCMWLARGRPDEARRLYERALHAAESHSGPVLSTTGDLHVGLADVLRERVTSMRPRSTWRSPASWATGRRCWRTGTAGTPRTPHCCRRKVTSKARSRCSTRLPLFLPGYFPDVRPIAATRARLRIIQGRLDDAGLGERAQGRTNRSADLPVRVQPAHPRPAARCRG